MKKRKDNRDIIFAIGMIVIVVIVGFGITNASKAQEIFGKTIRIISGDTEIIIEGDGFLEEALGGLVHNVQEDFSEGISVDGTEVITGAGTWTGRSIGSVSPSNIPTFGSSELPGCIIMGDDDYGGLSYTTVLNGSLTTTGGATTAFTIPSQCVTE